MEKKKIHTHTYAHTHTHTQTHTHTHTQRWQKTLEHGMLSTRHPTELLSNYDWSVLCTNDTAQRGDFSTRMEIKGN